MRVLETLFSILLILLTASLAVAQAPKRPTLTASPHSDDSVLLVYDPDNGKFGFTVPDVEPQLTTLEIKSVGGLFLPGNCENLEGDFDVCTADKIAKISVKGFGALSFGNVLPAGLLPETFTEGLIVDGSYLTGGTLGKYNNDQGVLLYVPEPSAAALGLLGVLSLLLSRRF